MDEHKEPEPPSYVLSLVEERERSRDRRDWASSDELRERIASEGWEVRDTPDGPELVSASSQQ